MQFILHIPMLANHRDEGGGRARQTGNVEAVVTRDGGVLMRHPNRFYSNHGLQTWPFRQFRKGGEVGDGPDSPPYGPAVRVIEGIKEVLGSAPGQVGFDVLMKVLFGRCIRLFVIAL